MESMNMRHFGPGCDWNLVGLMKRPCRAVETSRRLEGLSDGVTMKKVNSVQGTGRPFEMYCELLIGFLSIVINPFQCDGNYFSMPS